LHDEVRILNFGDPAEQEEWQRPIVQSHMEAQTCWWRRTIALAAARHAMKAFIRRNEPCCC
jgi:hypothetical protein